MEHLKDIYEDPSQPGSFSGVKSLYNEAKARGLNVTRRDVKEWLSKRQSYTLHKPARKRFKRNATVVFYRDELWQMDLCDMTQLKEYNDGNTFLLTIIDVFSKMGFAKPLLNKRGPTVLNAFREILAESLRQPDKLQSDFGTEFTNKNFQKTLRDKGIKFYVTFSENKAVVVERFNRTLKTKMWRYFTHKNTYRYTDVLAKLLKSYNSTPHSGIKGRTPDSINENNNLEVWRDSHAQPRRCRVKFKFSIDDKVRISRAKGVFEKGYTHNWSEEYFTVSDKIPRTPPVYRLKDLNGVVLKGVFYEEQLQSVSPGEIYPISNIKERRGKRALVSWRGWPSPDFDSWIPLADLQQI